MSLPRAGAWQRLGIAAVIGGIAGFGQAPYDVPLALVLAFAVAFHLFRAQTSLRHAALFGWAFGTGYFAHALQWIVSPFFVDAARHGWMAPFALLFLAAGLALFWAAAFCAARLISPRAIWPLILTLPLAELTRAYVFTGFPWAMPAQTILDTPLSPLLALVGPHGVNLVLIGLAMVLVASREPFRRSYFAAPLLVFYVVVFQLAQLPLPDITLTPHSVRMIQPNAPQHEKWDPEKIPVFFQRQLQFTAAPPKDGDAAPDLILWPETAIPWRVERADAPLSQIAEAGGAATVALGAIRVAEQRYYNAMVVLDEQGGVTQAYDKHHLVPFGEYMPFGDQLARLGIFGLAELEGSGYASGLGAKLVDFGPLGKALPLICYEAVFPQDVHAAPDRPDFLLQITNDAWFGRAAGPRQHLAQARMRAIEQGLPLARAANTGVSAMIDPYGQITASLPLNEAGFIDAPLPEPLPPTPYSRTGDAAFAFLLILGTLSAALRGRWRQPMVSD